MAKNKKDNELQIVDANPITTLRNFEDGFVAFLGTYNLPQQNIFVEVDERLRVFQNLETVISKISEPKQVENSLYISKFLAAAAAGLFDSALNYMWNETILQIRKRVAQYDLEFFYDSILGGDKRRQFVDESDLQNLQDYDLIRGAREIGLISSVGFKHLEHINFMRNWASAAHPNSVELTGLQMVSWLETCIKEVISLPMGSVVTRTKELLNNLRRNSISTEEAEEISEFFEDIPVGQADNLGAAFFSIYTRETTTEELKQNIAKLAPKLWPYTSEEAKDAVGLQYSHFTAHSVEPQKVAARTYIEIVQGQKYIPDGLRSREISVAIQRLVDAHHGRDNFYNEPPYARELKRVVGEGGTIPKQVRKKYVQGLVDVFLTNGHGKTRSADPIYLDLLNSMTSTMLCRAFLLFRDEYISSKLQHSRCKRKFDELIEICRENITSKAFLDFIDTVLAYNIPYDRLKGDSRVKREIETVKALLASK